MGKLPLSIHFATADSSKHVANERPRTNPYRGRPRQVLVLILGPCQCYPFARCDFCHLGRATERQHRPCIGWSRRWSPCYDPHLCFSSKIFSSYLTYFFINPPAPRIALKAATALCG